MKQGYSSIMHPSPLVLGKTKVLVPDLVLSIFNINWCCFSHRLLTLIRHSKIISFFLFVSHFLWIVFFLCSFICNLYEVLFAIMFFFVLFRFQRSSLQSCRLCEAFCIVVFACLFMKWYETFTCMRRERLYIFVNMFKFKQINVFKLWIHNIEKFLGCILRFSSLIFSYFCFVIHNMVKKIIITFSFSHLLGPLVMLEIWQCYCDLVYCCNEKLKYNEKHDDTRQCC